ncbi:DJ-1/PfpI family protein [Nocardia sp. NPDC004860]|uniref:DJ-1/PfpI family protein n=1 Tax=unclassified Nocardia TaxID=2637762 RepID=UPI0033B04F02
MERRVVLRALMAAGGAATFATTSPRIGAPEAKADGQGPAGPLRVHIVMFDGVEEQDFIGPFEVFSLAAMLAERGVDLRYVTTGQPGTIRASYGTVVQVTEPWAPQNADVLVVPGGGYTHRDAPGVWAEINRGVLPEALAAAPRAGLTISSLCTGAMLLGAAGLINGRPCTTHHGAFDTLKQQGGVLTKARVVDDGDLVTAGGITSGIDLALWLVRRELGAETATRVEEILEYEARGPIWTR